jgi:hypothetical protein
MKLPDFLPAPAAIARETLVVMAGAILAALIVGQFPQVKAWIHQQWNT